MFVARLAAASLAALALASPAHAGRLALSAARPAAPQDVKPFLLRADEPAVHSFPRTPSFGWKPVRGAVRYEFELATSPRFGEGTVIWSNSELKSPAVAIPVALPWMTGAPYALYAHVRAITRDAATAWSPPYELNMRWPNLPTSLPAHPGLIRWTSVEGATSYHVWYPDAAKVIATRTNVADLREFYTFHQTYSYTNAVRYRVRAVRTLYGPIPSGLPAVTYGPWTPLQTSYNPPFATGSFRQIAAISDQQSKEGPVAHRLTPGFAFSGNQSLVGAASELYRVYVFTDGDCVNIVFRGAIVGSPAYAPRTTGPLALPASSDGITAARTKYLKDGSEPATFMADLARISTTESDKPPAPPKEEPASGGGSGGSQGGSGEDSSKPEDSGAPELPPSTDPASLPSTPTVTGAPVDLWDSGWPNGRYHWTVVPVNAVAVPAEKTKLAAAVSAGATTITVDDVTGFGASVKIEIGTGATRETATISSVSGKTLTLASGLLYAHGVADEVKALTDTIEYRDVELPQDVCAAGRVMTFGKQSEPVVTGSTAPFASGLSPKGRLVAASGRKPSFYGSPLVAWQPALGADQYQVQWSPTRYPWNPIDPGTGKKYEKLTYATSAILPLKPGKWYYRVRGLNFSLPGTARAMSWSDAVELVVAKPRFAVVRR